LPDLPKRVEYVWDWYLEIANGERLTWQEIRSWSELCNKEVTTTEAEAIRKLSFLQSRIASEDD
jgi:hypothetical protein